MTLNIAYMTSRQAPMIHWFFDSLHRECAGLYDGLRLIVVDFHADTPGRRDAFAKAAHCDIVHVPAKPTVWQGPHRLTTTDYFAAANARNTAVCLARDGWIVFVDDLSVLLPGWLACVRRAIERRYIVCGTYKKVLALVVENGEAVYYREHTAGLDSRWKLCRDDGPVRLPGGAMYGCSVAMPLEAILDINGYDEDCDCMGLGSEDYIAGIMLEHRGYDIRLDCKMQTLESEERHHWEKPMKRVIEGEPESQNNASWAILGPVVAGKRTAAPNYFDGGIRCLRERVLAGEPFPVMKIPEHSWYSGRHLSTL